MAKKLDVGCGRRKQKGFIGLDIDDYPGVDIIHDASLGLPFEDNELDEIYNSNFLEHLTCDQALDMMCEFYRVLRPGGRLRIIVPGVHDYGWYCDLTHRSFWGPMSFRYFTGYAVGKLKYYKTFYLSAFKQIELTTVGIEIHALLEKP